MDKYEKIKRALEVQNTSWEKEELWDSIEENIKPSEKKDHRLLWLLLPGSFVLLLLALYLDQGMVLTQEKSNKPTIPEAEETFISERSTKKKGDRPELLTNLSDPLVTKKEINDIESYIAPIPRFEKIKTAPGYSSSSNGLIEISKSIPGQLVSKDVPVKNTAEIPFIDLHKAFLNRSEFSGYPNQLQLRPSHAVNENPGQNYFFNALRGRLEYARGQLTDDTYKREGNGSSNLSPKESISIGLDFFVFNSPKFYGTIGWNYRRFRYHLNMIQSLELQEEVSSPMAYAIVSNSAGTVFRPGLLTQTQTTYYNLEASNIVSALQMPLELGWRSQIFHEDAYGFFLGAGMDIYRSHRGSLLENTAMETINQSNMPMTLSNVFVGLFFDKHLKQGMTIGLRLQYLRDLNDRIDIEAYSLRLQELSLGIQLRKEFSY